TATNDDSGQKNRVRAHGLDPAVAWVPGRIGGALALTSTAGGGGHLTVESSPSLNQIGEELTIAVWLWRPASGAGVIVSRRASAAGGSLYRLEMSADDRFCLVFDDR